MRIAITGGIGSGKSYVCRMLKEMGVNVYDCDAGAKRLMRESEDLKQRLCALIGEDAYIDGKLNKSAVSRFLLSSEENKLAINHIVHPAVIEDFYASGLEWMESAILFDAHLENTVDRIVCVTAPENVRIERIILRDHISHDQALDWIHAQMPQDEAAKRSDFVIVNDGIADISEQLRTLLLKISN